MQRSRLEAHNSQQSKNEQNMIISGEFSEQLTFSVHSKKSRKPVPQTPGGYSDTWSSHCSSIDNL